MAPCNGTTSTPQSWPSPSPPNHSTLQWHPAMAPSNGTTSTPPKFPPNHSTLQWHPAMAPRPLPQSWLSPSPQPYHTTMAPYDGTQEWHHGHSPKVGRQPPTLQRQCAMANGTTSTAPCNGTLVPRPISQSGSSPSPPFGSQNPYSYRYLGKNTWINHDMVNPLSIGFTPGPRNSYHQNMVIFFGGNTYTPSFATITWRGRRSNPSQMLNVWNIYLPFPYKISKMYVNNCKNTIHSVFGYTIPL